MGACWAHNPEVDGSKPSSAIIFSSSIVFLSTTNSELWSLRIQLCQQSGRALGGQ